MSLLHFDDLYIICTGWDEVDVYDEVILMNLKKQLTYVPLPNQEAAQINPMEERKEKEIEEKELVLV